MSYEKKYLKYKTKYNELKLTGGAVPTLEIENSLQSSQYEFIDIEYSSVTFLLRTYGDAIKKELIKLIINMMDIIIIFNRDKGIPEASYYKIILAAFFIDKPSEYGQIGKEQINQIGQFIPFINRAPIRVLMIMIKNFQAGEMNCMMYEIFILYRISPVKFMTLYGNILNSNEVIKGIKVIENYLDVDIEYTNKCYRDNMNRHFRVNGMIPDPENPTKKKFDESVIGKDYKETDCTETKRMYSEWGYDGYTNICSLWLPMTFMTPFQSIFKLSVDSKNEYFQLIGDKTVIKIDEADYKGCTEFLNRYKFIEDLIKEERVYINSKLQHDDKINEVEGSDYNRKSLSKVYKPIVCINKIKEPKSWYYSVRRNMNNHYDLGQTSGHTLFMILLGRYFNTNDKLMVLAQIIWTVPYNHSLYEVFSAAKTMDIFPEFRWANDIKTNMDTFLAKL